MSKEKTFVFEIDVYWCLREMQNHKENIRKNEYEYTISDQSFSGQQMHNLLTI
jgi:hypothetical protein